MMNVVIDSNILFSALIRDSLTRIIIMEYEGFFIFPMYIFEELEKHKIELQRKSGLTEAEFNQLLGLLLSKVVIAPNELLKKHRKEAIETVKDIDLYDAPFIACTLAYPNSILWTDDKKLKKLKNITALNTQEIICLLG
ncbi:MAG: PIN domain-containing protein [Candidatus Altiarchaeota archaeon]